MVTRKRDLPPRPVKVPYTRLRKERGIVGTPIYIETRTPPSDWAVQNTVYDTYLAGENRTMVDVVTPDFNLLRKSGNVVFTPMNREIVTVAAQGSDYHIRNIHAPFPEQRTRGGTLGNYCVPNVVVDGIRYPLESSVLDPGDVNSLMIECSTEALSKRGRSDSDIWESLAEYRQALALLENPINRLKTLASKLEAPGNSKSRLLLKEVSGAYLLKRFGIDPLLKDIQSVLKSLQRVTGKQRKTTRAKGSLFGTRTIGGSSSFDWNDITYTQDVVEKVDVRAMCLDEVDISFGGNIGFSTRGLITLPWELLGYSFLADYLANIGDIIGANAPAPGYNLLGSCLTVNRVLTNAYTWTSTGRPLVPDVPLASPFNGQTAVVRQTRSRGPLTQPGFVIRSDLKLDQFTRSATLLTLLANRFTKISKFVGPQPNLSAFRQRSAYTKWAQAVGL
jgi:hypothetical protein